MSRSREGIDITDDIIKASGREPILLARETIVCPVCGRKSLELSEYLYEVPHFGLLILSSGTCKSCGFKYRDVRVAETTKPKQIIVRVLGEEQLRYMLVKSALTGVLIPEQGYEIIPGPASTGFISTVEGILHRIMEALEVACRDSPDKKEECEKHRRWLEEAIEGKKQFTLILCDFEGASKVLGEYVEEKDIGNECDRFREYLKGRIL